jgi:phosphodiesterase/alkaline phosphatase D-like protein
MINCMPRSLARAALLLLCFLLIVPAADAAGPPFQPPGFAHRRVCKNVPTPRVHCDSEIVLDAFGQPLVTDTPLGYGPADLQSAYNLSSAAASAGATQTIAIVDAYDDPNAEADLGSYRTQYGLPACTTSNGCFRKVNQAGSSTGLPAASDSWAKEISLDLDMASAICPNCKILLVEASSSYSNDLATAVDEAVTLGATQVSNSYGAAEYSGETTVESSYHHPGIAMTVSSGDYGYGVEFPASSQYVTAVGGTSLQSDSSARGWSESAWGTTANSPPAGAGSGCSLYEPKPAWQTDTGCANRSVADVSAEADPATGVAVYDSYGTAGGWIVVGGTSASAPIIAGFDALIGAGAAPASYVYSHPGYFNDVTSGSNGSCSGGYLCTAAVGYDGPTGLGTPNGGAIFGLPAASTGAATAVTDSAATLAGTVNPHGAAATYHFEYGTSRSYGSSTTSSSAGSGSSAVPVSADITGLAQGTTYHYRLVASNTAGGVSDGADHSFRTNGPPVVTTGAASSITATGAMVAGTVNPLGQATMVHVEYGTTTSYGTSTPSFSAGSGNSTVSLSVGVGGLSPGTEYHYRIVATNATGTGNGDDATFTTASGPPAVTTGSASSVTTSGATVAGTVNPGGVPTTYHFEFGTSTAYGTSTADDPAGSGTSAVPVSADLTGLTQGTTYYYRLVATSSAGTSYGSAQTLTTTTLFSATTGAASAITYHSAAVAGTVNPGGLATSYHFEYGSSPSYGATTPAVDAGAGSSPVDASAALANLNPAEEYHYRLVATNSTGTIHGDDQTFTTALPPPLAATGAATNITDSAANVSGSFVAQGLDTHYHFEYGPTTSYGTSTQDIDAGAPPSFMSVQAGLTGLAPSTAYHFRLVATNASGTTNGDDAVFTTQPTPSGSGTQDQQSTQVTQTQTQTPTSVPTPPPPATLAAPSLAVPAHVSLRALLARGVSSTVSCAGPCQVRGSLVLPAATARHYKLGHKKTVVGKVKLSLAKGGSGKLVVRLSALARKRLRHARSLKLTLQLVVADAAGQHHTLSRTVAVKH